MLMPLVALHCQEKFKLPEGWGIFIIEAKETFHLITGAVCTEVYKKGHRKGQPNWRRRDRSTQATVTLTCAEHEIWLHGWEQKTGKCSVCQGFGERVVGWNVDTGIRYAKCKSCGGSGKKPISGQV